MRAGGVLEALEQLLRLELPREALARVLLGGVERAVLRRLCPHCRVPRPLEEAEAACLGAAAGTEIRAPAGCPRCGDGFLGRRTAYGVWPADEALSTWIRVPEAPPPAAGELSLERAVRRAVLAGEVDLEEADPWLSPPLEDR